MVVGSVLQVPQWPRALEAILDRMPRAAILVTAESRIVYANRPADLLLRGGRGIRSRAGRLTLASKKQGQRLREMVRGAAVALKSEAALPSGMVLSGDGGNPTHLIRAWPLPAALGAAVKGGPLVHLSIASLRHEVRLDTGVAGLFHLSRREAQIGEALCCGDTISSAADRLGISLATARGYLKSLRAKIGAANQKDTVLALVRLSEEPIG